MTNAEARRAGRTTVLGLVALGALHLVRYRDPAFVLDDAWISFRSARNWLELGLPAFNQEGPPVEAVTNVGWTAVSALAQAVSLSPLVAARGLGAVAWLLALGLVVAAAQRLGGRAAALGCGLPLLLAPSLAFHAMSGLETAAWCACVAWCLALGLRSELGMRGIASCGLALGIGFTLRPEVALYGPAFVLIMALGHPAGRRWLLALVPLALVGLGVEAWRWFSFGELVPNTFHAKPPSAALGWEYLLRFLRSTGLALPFGLTLGLLDRRTRPLAGWGAVVIAGVVFTGGDWMDGYRRLSELALVLALCLGLSLTVKSTRPWAALALISWCMASAVAAWRQSDERLTESSAHVAIAQLAAQSSIHRVALADIGIFGWYFPGEIYDTGGLAEPAVARAPGAHGERWVEEHFREQSPDLLVAVGVPGQQDTLLFEGPDLLMLRSTVGRGYRLQAMWPEADRQILVLFRDDVEADPELWGPAVAPDATSGLMSYLESFSPTP